MVIIITTTVVYIIWRVRLPLFLGLFLVYCRLFSFFQFSIVDIVTIFLNSFLRLSLLMKYINFNFRYDSFSLSLFHLRLFTVFFCFFLFFF